jgi:AcrR family transcriptional regulator
MIQQHTITVRERRKRERLARRDAILMAAAKVFAAHGIEGATIEMVAREAELAVGTIYLYFCSRDDLYLSLVAERIRQIRARYLEIKARRLAPLEELHAMTAAYLDYLKESRGLFLAQLSVEHSQLFGRLKRRAEIENYRRVMALSREVFGLWASSVGRVYDGGLIYGELSRARTAAVIWAALNGAFLLTRDPEVFRDITELDAGNFIEEAFDFLISGAGSGRTRSRAPSTRGAKLKPGRTGKMRAVAG